MGIRLGVVPTLLVLAGCGRTVRSSVTEKTLTLDEGDLGQRVTS